jgi:hypothetical protein
LVHAKKSLKPWEQTTQAHHASRREENQPKPRGEDRMRKTRKSMMRTLCLGVFFTCSAHGASPPKNNPRAPVSVSTLWHLRYAFGEQNNVPYGKSSVGRGYLTLKFKPVKWFEPRITLDTHQEDSGDWEMRLKYLHAKFKLPNLAKVVTSPYIEFGIAHTPWFDFEEHINRYRMEGQMFIERNGLLNSADLGITVGGLWGDKLPKELQVHSKYPGEYGSFALGIYNGGGYHAKETNPNKVFQSRLTIRPLGSLFPGLQLSHLFIYGKGNLPEEPDYRVNNFMLSYEHKYVVLTAQYTQGKGNQKGNMRDSAGESIDFHGFSFFTEIKILEYKSSFIGRFDRFDWNTSGGPTDAYPIKQRIIAGYAFHLLPLNTLLLSYDRVSYTDSTWPNDWSIKLTLQVHYPL